MPVFNHVLCCFNRAHVSCSHLREYVISNVDLSRISRWWSSLPFSMCHHLNLVLKVVLDSNFDEVDNRPTSIVIQCWHGGNTFCPLTVVRYNFKNLSSSFLPATWLHITSINAAGGISFLQYLNGRWWIRVLRLQYGDCQCIWNVLTNHWRSLYCSSVGSSAKFFSVICSTSSVSPLRKTGIRWYGSAQRRLEL